MNCMPLLSNATINSAAFALTSCFPLSHRLHSSDWTLLLAENAKEVALMTSICVVARSAIETAVRGMGLGDRIHRPPVLLDLSWTSGKDFLKYMVTGEIFHYIATQTLVEVCCAAARELPSACFPTLRLDTLHLLIDITHRFFQNIMQHGVSPWDTLPHRWGANDNSRFSLALLDTALFIMTSIALSQIATSTLVIYVGTLIITHVALQALLSYVKNPGAENSLLKHAVTPLAFGIAYTLTQLPLSSEEWPVPLALGVLTPAFLSNFHLYRYAFIVISNRSFCPSTEDSSYNAQRPPPEDYALIGIDSDATYDDFIRQRRRKSAPLHPDRPGGNKVAFQNLQAAAERIRIYHNWT